MFDLLLHPDRFWVKTFWPITVAALCVWLASKIIAHANAGRWLWRACLLKLLAVSLVPISLAIEFLPAECRDLIWSLIAAVATTVFFFHPLVWFARRRLLIAQESAADGLTLRVTGASVGQYANLVVRIIEKSHRIRTRPAFVVRAGSTFRELKERIEKMHARPRSNALVVSLAIVAVIVSLLPWHADFVRPAAAGDEPATRPRETKSAAGGAREFSFRAELREVLPDFPYSVRFQQGATRLPAGDKIVITEVKGTAETMAPGNIYLVRGTYKLTSHERASLSVFTTAKYVVGPGEFVMGSNALKVQTTSVTKGEGTFTLYLPMTGDGFPHVSFYPAQGGGDIGGTYFGTGDSVLKRWWGEK